MAKFLNKKEQVYDLQLTSYGKHLLSMGAFKPVYYGFYDDNILYDGAYAGLTEGQNEIQKRIKEDTVYLEGLTRFTDVEDEPFTGTSAGYIDCPACSGGDDLPPGIRAVSYYEIDFIKR